MMNNKLEVLMKLLDAMSKLSYDLASMYEGMHDEKMAHSMRKESCVYNDILRILQSDHLMRDMCDIYCIDYKEETV